MCCQELHRSTCVAEFHTYTLQVITGPLEKLLADFISGHKKLKDLYSAPLSFQDYAHISGHWKSCWRISQGNIASWKTYILHRCRFKNTHNYRAIGRAAGGYQKRTALGDTRSWKTYRLHRCCSR